MQFEAKILIHADILLHHSGMKLGVHSVSLYCKMNVQGMKANLKEDPYRQSIRVVCPTYMVHF